MTIPPLISPSNSATTSASPSSSSSGSFPTPHANLRHYAFMQQAFPDTARRLAARNIAFVLRRHPHADLAAFCDEVSAALLVGDENPMRDPRAGATRWPKSCASPTSPWMPTSSYPADSCSKAQYAARTIRPRLKALLDDYLVPCTNPRAQFSFDVAFKPASLDPASDLTSGWSALDRSVAARPQLPGRHHRGLSRNSTTSSATVSPTILTCKARPSAMAPAACRPTCTSDTSRPSPSPWPCGRRRPRGGQGEISRPAHHLARAGHQLRPLQPALRFHRVRRALGAQVAGRPRR